MRKRAISDELQLPAETLSEQAQLRHRAPGIIDVVGYSPPMLRVNKTGWYVDYYVLHPVTRKKMRMRTKLNRIKGRNARYAHARKLIAELTIKLQSGWTPWTKGSESLNTIEEVLGRWDRMKERQSRHSSPYTYTSMTAILRNWFRQQGYLHRYTVELSRTIVGRFLDHVSEERLVGNRTYNNYLVYLGMLFKWMIEQGYLESRSHLKKVGAREWMRMRVGQSLGS